MRFRLLLLLALLPHAAHPGLTVIPMAFYTPETSLAAGVSPLYLFPPRADTRRSSLVGLAIVTLNKQVQGFVTGTHYFMQNRAVLKGGIYARHYPLKFFGIGDATREADEEPWLEDSFRVEGSLLFRLRPFLYLGPRFEYEGLSVREREAGGLLDTGTIPGSGGSRFSGAGLLLRFDSTDDEFQPGRGVFLEGQFTASGTLLGADRASRELSVDGRLFLPLPRRRVLAFQLLFESGGGDVSFNRMPELGGAKLLRGYYEGRFREKNLLALQGEFRSPLYKRLGFTLFAGTGAVAREVSGLAEARWKWTAGGGLRFRLRRDSGLTLRLDLAGNHESFGVYILGLEAF